MKSCENDKKVCHIKYPNSGLGAFLDITGVYGSNPKVLNKCNVDVLLVTADTAQASLL